MQYLNLSPGAGALGRFPGADDGTVIPQGSSTFAPIYSATVSNLRTLLSVPYGGEVLMIACSGTGGIEALLHNALERGDRILVLANGYFGERLARMARRLGFDAYTICSDWRRPLDVARVLDHIRSDAFSDTKAVFAVHLETSTGLVNDISPIGEALRNLEAMYFVDAVSSVGPHRIEMGSWAIDGLVTVSYKGLMTPPALTMVAISEKYRKRMARVARLNYYFDFDRIMRFASNSTSATPVPTNSLLALRHVTSEIVRHGTEQYELMCRATAEQIRTGLKDLGYSVYGRSGHSYGITALLLQGALKDIGGRAGMQVKHRVYVGAGLGELEEKIIRLGHFRPMSEQELSTVLKIFEQIRDEAGLSGESAGLLTM